MPVSTRKLTVLQVLPDPARYPGPVENPYTSLLVDSLDGTAIRTEYFRWTTAFWRPFDVVHFHWPEYMARHRSALVSTIKCLLLWLFILRVRASRSALVRTVHNVAPHESGPALERRVLAALDSATTLWIVLNSATQTPVPSRTRLLPHGHYRDWYDAPRVGASTRGRLLTFGLQRAYKGTNTLIEAFGQLPQPDFQLHVCGKPATAQDRIEISQAAQESADIHLDLRFLDDAELVDEIAASETVVLPYRSMHNSGAALLALSLNRPIIVPLSEATALLVQEFGPQWVVTYAGQLTGEALRSALERVRGAKREPEVDMASREWGTLARLLEQMYHEAVSLAKAGRR